MPIYEESLTIQAQPDAIFAFASQAANMPKYLNTVQEAHDQGSKEGDRSRILMKGEANGHAYESDGWIEYKDGANTMTWGSDGENDYSGALDVDADGEGAKVTVRLNFEPKEGQDAEFEKAMGSRDAAIREGLKTSLQSLKNQIEGDGGKVPSPMATEPAAAGAR